MNIRTGTLNESALVAQPAWSASCCDLSLGTSDSSSTALINKDTDVKLHLCRIAYADVYSTDTIKDSTNVSEALSQVLGPTLISLSSTSCTARYPLFINICFEIRGFLQRCVDGTRLETVRSSAEPRKQCVESHGYSCAIGCANRTPQLAVGRAD